MQAMPCNVVTKLPSMPCDAMRRSAMKARDVTSGRQRDSCNHIAHCVPVHVQKAPDVRRS